MNISQEHARKAINLLSSLAKESTAFCSCIEINQGSSLYGDRWMMEVKDLLNKLSNGVCLVYCVRTAVENNALIYPAAQVEKLGIFYNTYSVEHIADVWLFFGCTNIPNPLPPYLKVRN